MQAGTIHPPEAPILGYCFSGTHYCSGCIEGALCNNTYSQLHTAEQALDLIASDENIDRAREENYSYYDFPQILRENTGKTCADCGGELNKDLRDTPEDIRDLCVAAHDLGETCRLADGFPDGAHTIVTGASI